MIKIENLRHSALMGLIENTTLVGSRCSSEWTCTNWSACDNGSQRRTCVDNACHRTWGVPIQTQTCVTPITPDANVSVKEECVESWVCTNWSECQNSKTVRTCEDTNKCGTADKKPVLEGKCVSIIPDLKTDYNASVTGEKPSADISFLLMLLAAIIIVTGLFVFINTKRH